MVAGQGEVAVADALEQLLCDLVEGFWGEGVSGPKIRNTPLSGVLRSYSAGGAGNANPYEAIHVQTPDHVEIAVAENDAARLVGYVRICCPNPINDTKGIHVATKSGLRCVRQVFVAESPKNLFSG